MASQMPAGTRDAAMRFAEGDVAGARRCLEENLAQESGRKRDWLMLLDLERLEARWRAYEALAARYRMRFGEEAPTERERNSRESALPEELRPGGSGCVAFGGVLGANAVPGMVALQEAASRHTLVHVDVTRLENVDGVGSRLLQDTFAALVRAGNGIVLTGGEHLVRLLRRLLGTEPYQRAAWDLLLLVRRILQDREGFERDALQFSLAGNVEAPSWEPLLVPQTALHDPTERRSQPRYVPREMFALQGVITSPEDPQLVGAAAFAAASEYVNLNLANLERIGFPAATALARIVQHAAEAGRTVRLIRPHQLVAALLEILNLGQVAAILAPRA